MKTLFICLVCFIATAVRAENAPRYFSVTVIGAVAKPGVVTLDEKCGLGDAVARCGAFTRFADRKHVVVRDKSGDEKTYDLDLIFKGAIKGPQLSEGDTVIVSQKK